MKKAHLGTCSYVLALIALAAGCAAPIEGGSEPAAVQAQTQALRAPQVPDALAVPAGNRLAFYLEATGQQVYVCQQNATTLAYGFVLQAPDADLFWPNGRVAGSHYLGPTWEATDGSTVVGSKVAASTPDATAIPWLLLSAVSHTGRGLLSNVSYVQRLDTTGGLAPTTGCDADHVTQTQGVDYTATYYFYVPTPSCKH
jgi:hypothetical protein